MAPEKRSKKHKILILATETCAYPGADNVGQNHSEYPTNTYIIRVPAPVLFPEKFYLDSFNKGIDAIIVMSCGHECPYEGAYASLADRISTIHKLMKDAGIDPKRLRLCAICTVCSKSFLKEVRDMTEYLQKAEVS